MKQKSPLLPLEAAPLFSHASYDTSAITSSHLATGGASQMLNKKPLESPFLELVSP